MIVVVAAATWWLRPSRQMRVFWGFAALVLLFLLAFEGGWWLIPAVLAQITLDARAARASSTSPPPVVSPS